MSVPKSKRKRTRGERCSLATGSIPVWRAEAFAFVGAKKAIITSLRDKAAPNTYQRGYYAATVDAYAEAETMLNDLGRQMGLPALRQPETNTEVSHGGSAPLAVTTG